MKKLLMEIAIRRLRLEILSDYEVCRQLLYGWEQVSFLL